jgi:N-acetylglutamate synthase
VNDQKLLQIQILEELLLNALPCLQQILYDGWILRFAEGYTTRANSVTPLYPSSQKLLLKINRCECVYRDFDLQPIFRLADIPRLQILDRTLDDLGYHKQDLISVRLKNISQGYILSHPNVILSNELSEEWLDCYVHAIALPTRHWNTLSTILEIIPHPTCYALLKDRYRFCSCGLGVLENDYLSLLFIATAQKQRGKGYATQLISTMLHWGKQRGATKACLQVEIDNPGAIKLYDKFEFTEVYQYFYRLKL